MRPSLTRHSVRSLFLLSWDFDFYGLPLMRDFRGLGRLRHKQRPYRHLFPDGSCVMMEPLYAGRMAPDETCQLASPGTKQASGVRVNIYRHLMLTVLRLFVYLFSRQLGFTEQKPLFSPWITEHLSYGKELSGKPAQASVCGACLQLLL